MSELLARFTGTLAGRYAVDREVGCGGMAVVHLAASLGAERFLRKIEIVAGLQHPHILPLDASGGAHELLYYVMSYAAGESLRQRL